MTAKLSDDERMRIIDLLQEHGGNQNRVAKICGRAQSTVGTIANQEGIQSFNLAPKKAIAVKAAVEKIDKLEVVGLGLKVAESFLNGLNGRLPTLENVRAFKEAMTGLGIGIDKDQLLRGEATERREETKRFDIEQEFRKLDAKFGAG